MNFICRLVFGSLIVTAPLLQSCVADGSGDNPITSKREPVNVLKCDRNSEGEVVKPADDSDARICRDGKWVVFEGEKGEEIDFESSSSEKSSSSKHRESVDDGVKELSSSSRSIRRSSSSFIDDDLLGDGESSSSKKDMESSSSKPADSSNESNDIESSADAGSSDDTEIKADSSSDESGKPAVESSSANDPVDVIYECNDGITKVLDPENCPAEPQSSSENVVAPVRPDGEFPSIESYGTPDPSYTRDISGNGKTGWNARYWDACKLYCSYIGEGVDTTTQASYEASMTTARNCNIHDVEVPTFTLSHAVGKYWMGLQATTSACDMNAGAGGVFTCTDMAPIAVNDQLSYAYVVSPASGAACGRCYHLQYDGSFVGASDIDTPKETHKALKGKHLVVMAANVGHDVREGQFDLMVPGGGSGIFDAFSMQVMRFMTEEEREKIDWGPAYGGFLTHCQRELGFDNTLEKYQACVKDMCDETFGNAGLPNLLRGCHWFADWYMAADNPTFNWEEVECPQYLLDHYLTTLNKEKSNRYAWHTDWSTYKDGDPLETLECGDLGLGIDGCICTEEMAAKGACRL